MWCCLFFLFFMCVCVWFAHSGHPLSVSVWTLIDSCSHAPSGQLTCSYMHLSLSLSQSILSSFSFFSHFLSVSSAHKLIFSCQTVIDMILYLKQSAIIKNTCLNISTQSLSTMGKFTIMIKDSQKGLVRKIIILRYQIKSKFIKCKTMECAEVMQGNEMIFLWNKKYKWQSLEPPI